MKRIAEDYADAPLAKVPRQDDESVAVAVAQVHRPWYFITDGDGGTYFIHKWFPPSPKAAAAVLAAHTKSRALHIPGGIQLRYFSQAMDWLAPLSIDAPNEIDKPAEFAGLSREDFGTFEEICCRGHPGDVEFDGRVFLYESWY